MIVLVKSGECLIPSEGPPGHIEKYCNVLCWYEYIEIIIIYFYVNKENLAKGDVGKS